MYLPDTGRENLLTEAVLKFVLRVHTVPGIVNPAEN